MAQEREREGLTTEQGVNDQGREGRELPPEPKPEQAREQEHEQEMDLQDKDIAEAP
jgi:hypothetical protein